MNTITAEDTRRAENRLSTADLAAAASGRQAPDASAAADGVQPQAGAEGSAELAQLFPEDLASGFRARWDEVQIGFVDDPGKAVREADELVAEVMKRLADSFATARSSVESEISQAGNASTESMRVALQRYRSFFQRLLSL